MSLIPLKRNKQEWDHDNHPYSFDNPNIYMRPATEDDVDNMYSWEMESIDKSLQEDPKVQQLIRDDCYQSIKDTQMIMDQDKTIGMFTACMIDNGEWRYIGEIYLVPEYRGQHIGSTILKNEIANYDRIRLQVAYDNENALRLYKSLGFKIVKENKEAKLYIMEYDKSLPVTEAFFKEAYLKAKERNELEDSKFGIPELRKYPLTDETHIKMAVKFFGKAPKKYKLSLAKRILRAAHSHDMDTKDWDSINDYIKNHKESVVQEAAYRKGINKANIQSVVIVYKRFSTKNDEQYGPIKKFWEISDKYFTEPHMTSGFGWDWTDKPDFAYGIIINEKNIPDEFMKEMKAAFPDVKIDKHFLIPNKYEQVFTCPLKSCQETYDKIWSKGPLECELEEYPSEGQMKISVIYQKDKDKLEKEVSKYIKHIKESYTERKNLIMKEQVTKILEAYNSGVLTQEEATEKINTIQEEAVEKIIQEGPFPNAFTSGDPSNKDLIKYFTQNKNGEITYPEMLKKVLQAVRSQDWEGATRAEILKKMSNNWDERYFRHINDAYEKIVEDRYSRKLASTEDYDAYNDATAKIGGWVSNLKTLRPDAMRSKKEQKEHDDQMKQSFPDPERRKEAEDFTRRQKMSYADRLNEGAIMNELREKQEKIMESFKMGIINGTEGMRLMERVLMESDYYMEEDTDFEGDDDNEPEDITPEDADGDTINGDDSNIDALADYINSLSADEKTALLGKISGSDEPTDDDANGNEEVPTDDDAPAGEPTTEETVDPASISDASLNDSNASLDDMEV